MKKTLDELQAQREAQRRAEEPAGFVIDPASEGRYLLSDAAIQKTLSGLGHPRLIDDIRALSQNAGIEAPHILIDYKQPDMPASATIMNGQYTIVLNNKFIKSRSRESLNGVIGHELAHIKLGHLDNDASSYTPFENLVWMAAPKLWRLAWRRRESAADKQGALIAGGTEGLVDFFRDGIQQEKATRPSGIVSRIMNSRPVRFLKSISGDDHPTYEKRVKKLEQLTRTHPAELETAKSKLDAFQGKAGQQFAQAASRAALPSPSAPRSGPSAAAVFSPAPRMR